MKDFKVLATERYSVRKFDTRQVEQEKVDMLTSSRSISTYGAQLSATTTARVKYRR